MNKVLLFWLDKGVDGFRVDALSHLFENENLHDDPPSTRKVPKHEFESLDHVHTKDQPETYDLLHQWRQLLDTYSRDKGGPCRILMGEVYTTIEKKTLYYGTPDGTKPGAHFMFNLYLVGAARAYVPMERIVGSINYWLSGMPPIYTSSWVLSNHDNHRIATRCGPENVDGFNMLKAVLPGIDVTYYGEEIGQEDGEVLFEENQDFTVTNREGFERLCRDFSRTPFQWDESTNAGFNDGTKPWLPVSQKYHHTNLQKQKESSQSHYKVFQDLVKMRRDSVLVNGDVKVKSVSDQTILVKRSYGSSVVLVFNKGGSEVVIDVSEDVADQNLVKIKSVGSLRELESRVDPRSLRLEGHEALIIVC